MTARFATSARAVDMLGRQQIASVPTALSELFKNSYDAYARVVRADYLRAQRALLLRDDGVGMSRVDFLERWLVLGTDSKADNSSRPRPPVPPRAQPRPTMGEKGIGRLAIAAVGPLVMVVSRPQFGDATDKSVVALVPWSLFEAPGLLLDDVAIPLHETKDPWPTPRLRKSMCDEVRANLEALGERLAAELVERVEAQLAALQDCDVDPAGVDGPAFPDRAHGASFLVVPVNDELEAVMTPATEQQLSDGSTDFERLLIGFTNTMLPEHASFPMTASFLVHDENAEARDLISPTEFWTPEDFARVDHTIEGSFDESGTFDGTVSVYGTEPQDHVVSWPEGARRGARCGPFSIRIGYLQGEMKGSRLDPMDYGQTSAKLARIGGLYIYRDGVRVLPYGSADVDYLGIEERRSRNAGRAYFSYRRMFGAIEISTSDNPKLRDKASREGLLDNAAFRDFKHILENFLMQTAADFFRTGGVQSDDFLETRSRLKDLEKERRAAAEQANARRQRYADQLQQRLDLLESGQAQDQLKAVADDVAQRLADGAAHDLADIERHALATVADLVEDLSLAEPEDVGLTDDQQRLLMEFQGRKQRLLSQDVPAAVNRLQSLIDEAATSQQARTLRHARVQQFEELTMESVAQVDEARRALDESVASTATELSRRADRLISDVRATIDDLRAEFAEHGAEGRAELQRLDTTVRSVSRSAQTQFLSMQERLVRVLDDSAVHEARLLQERLFSLERQVDTDVDLLLLGQAVQVIDHELEQTVGVARRALSDLRTATRPDTDLRSRVDRAGQAFEHLDGYLRLFTPMQRRTRRQRADIPGTRISSFLQSLFVERLARHNVTLKATRRFREGKSRAFPSTLLPVFVNLVDNAVHWTVSAHPAGGAAIVLDRDDNGDLLVKDNGPGVRSNDIDAIFDAGFSRRRGGRGLGLAISQQALKRDGWTLSIDPSTPGDGATFRLHENRDGEK